MHVFTSHFIRDTILILGSSGCLVEHCVSLQPPAQKQGEKILQVLQIEFGDEKQNGIR